MGHVLSRKKVKNKNQPQSEQEEKLQSTDESPVQEPAVTQLNTHQDLEIPLNDASNIEDNSKINSVIKTNIAEPETSGSTNNEENNNKTDSPIETNSVKLSLKEAALLKPTTPEEMWKIVKDSSDRKQICLKPTRNRKGWKTIRLFVSSTFKDFHHEREVLVKEVFPDLRLWCESRKLRLVECDLRWGVPKDSTSEETIKICLSELDRCYEDNTAPFFLNLAGDRAGWIPQFQDLSLNVATQYGWVYGLSVTEMEIVHGAVRKLNPNALFLVRNLENKDIIPEDLKPNFLSEESFLQEKLETLKEIVSTTFPETNVKHYNVRCDANSNEMKITGLSGEDSPFPNMVFDFFQSKIEELYPLDEGPLDPLQIQRDAHEMFLDSRSSCVLGRDKILQQIEDYVREGCSSQAPLLVVGIAGAGKSALMAKSAHRATELIDAKMIKIPSDAKCKVFFHFVGATPRSTDLASFLQRLVKEINPNQKEIMSDLDSLISLAYNLLENENTMPVIIFVDAINQMDEDKQQYLSRWLPEKLSPNVRIVLSTIESTSSHKTLRSYKTSPTEIICGPLDHESRKAIVENILRTYNKRLDEEQIIVLLEKDGSSNPLWLTLACEELRVYGKFETLIDRIHELPDNLITLEETVFARFEQESGGELTKACICLLEVSRHGLLETELLALLGDSKNVTIPEYKEIDEEALLNKTETSKETTANIEETKQNLTKLVQETYVKDEVSEAASKKDGPSKLKFKRPKGKQINFLPARDWALIYRNLKPLLRPCGDLGEGRLDFYHRSLSKAARRRYFSGDEKMKKHVYNFWHGVLADYFEGIDDMDRKAEELPYHLEQLLDNNRLIRCLMDWEVFNRLYSEEFSIDLLHAWRQCGGFGVASAVYKEQLTMLRKSENMPLIDYVEIVENVYTFLIQAGQYSEAIELMEERLNDELTHLGERPDEMADVYQNMARCKSEIDKAQQYISRDQLDDNRLIVEYGRKCLMYRKRLQNTSDNSYRCACANILVSHHLSNIADLNDDLIVRKEAFDAIDEAIKVFTELNDVGHLAECTMTKAIIDFSQPFQMRETLLLESLSLCLKAYGEHHLLTTRIHLNTGIAYEMAGDTQKAFHHLKKLKEICMAIFGPGHPKTVRAVKTLNEPRYRRMLEAEERQAAGMA